MLLARQGPSVMRSVTTSTNLENRIYLIGDIRNPDSKRKQSSLKTKTHSNVLCA
jgi:hypothetical protein